MVVEVMYQSCCGIDVHTKTVVVSVIRNGKKQTRTYSTMTDDLLALSDWLVSEECTHAAIESTSVYWKPVFNVLESVVEVILVNARNVKALPGRKTDVKDSEWLADLLRHGLLQASFIPPKPIRELRELIRHRQTLVAEQASVSNRILKQLESGNVKLAEVVSDALGVSGRLMIQALVEGEQDSEKIANLARGSLKRKKDQLKRAVRGTLSRSQRFVVKELLRQLKEIEAAIGRVNDEIKAQIKENNDPFVREAVNLLQTIPGVGERVAEVIIAEIGVDMSVFPTDKHLSSWGGMCPGNNESAGKRKSGKTTKGSPYLRAALTQAAWAASHTKQTYLSAQYKRLVKRRGRKKALIAVGHSILVISYHLLKKRCKYKELGVDFFDRQNTQAQCVRLIRRLTSLGVTVKLDPVTAGHLALKM